MRVELFLHTFRPFSGAVGLWLLFILSGDDAPTQNVIICRTYEQKEQPAAALSYEYLVNLENGLLNADPASAELHLASCQGKQSVVPAYTDIGPGSKFGAPLPHYNAAGLDLLSSEGLDPQKLCIAIPTVTG